MSYKSKYKGFFKPRNPQKYLGNIANIVYRSSYELKYMQFLDNHPDVLKWGSEEISIPYRGIDERLHQYYPDFLVQMKDKTGQIQSMLIEIKPASQVVAPKPRKKITSLYLKEVETYETNIRKWMAAQSFCEERGIEFKIFTEAELGIRRG